MFLLSVIESLLHGGAETVLVDLVRGLTAHRHEVVHFTRAHGTTPAPWIVEALALASVPCHDIHGSSLADPRARRALLGAEPDVVLLHWWGNSTFRPWSRAPANPAPDGLSLASRPPGRPRFVVVIHNTRYPGPPGFDAYVLVSPTQRPQVEAMDPSCVVVIPNGVDLSRFQTSSGDPQRNGNDPDAPGGGARRETRPFTIGRISSLNSKKIPPDWVTTAVGYGVDDARFVIAGDGPLRPALESDARRLGLDGRFVFPGYVSRDEVPRLLSTFDVLCYVGGSAAEAHPLVLLEACAAGVPIVTEAKGGIPDIVRHGVNGLLAGRDDVATHLRLLRDNETLRCQLARGARQVAREFSIERQLTGYGRLLELENCW